MHSDSSLVADGWNGLKEFLAIFDRHVEDIGYAHLLELDFEGFFVEALALAALTGHIDIGQEVHFDLDQAITLAGLAAPALDIEREPRPLGSHAASLRAIA